MERNKSDSKIQRLESLVKLYSAASFANLSLYLELHYPVFKTKALHSKQAIIVGFQQNNIYPQHAF